MGGQFQIRRLRPLDARTNNKTMIKIYILMLQNINPADEMARNADEMLSMLLRAMPFVFGIFVVFLAFRFMMSQGGENSASNKSTRPVKREFAHSVKTELPLLNCAFCRSKFRNEARQCPNCGAQA